MKYCLQQCAILSAALVLVGSCRVRELKTLFGTVLCLIFFLCNASAQFQHRAYYGWITDLASEGRPNDAWPSTRIDNKLLNDYDDNLKFMHEIGLVTESAADKDDVACYFGDIGG